MIAGPGAGDDALAEAIARFSKGTGWPVLADATSSLRGHEGLDPIAHFDALLRAPSFADGHRPEAVLQLGATPVSKSLRLWLEAHEPSVYLRVDPGGGFEPSRLASDTLRAEPVRLLGDLSALLESPRQRSLEWSRAFVAANERAHGLLQEELACARALVSPVVALALARSLPDDGLLYAANSLAVRDLDTCLRERAGQRVLCNRGANGIVGKVSSALGAAAAGQGPVALLCGDLAFLHDVGGLLAAHRLGLRLVCVVLNDDGGGIFSHLPIAKQGQAVGFEALFRTPHGLELGPAAELYGARYERCESAEALRIALKGAWARSESTVIEVPIDPTRDLSFSTRILDRLRAALAA